MVSDVIVHWRIGVCDKVYYLLHRAETANLEELYNGLENCDLARSDSGGVREF